MMRKSEAVADSELNKIPSASSGKRKLSIIFMLVGIVTGAGLIVLSGCQSMSGRMVTVHQSKCQSVDQTCEVLKTAIEAQGLKCLAIRNLNKSMAKHGVHLNRQVRVVEFCKADYAHDMLKDNPEVCTLMPCTFGVYEGDDGRVYISTMNQHLMGKMSGIAIARVMGEYVAQDQADILKAVELQSADSLADAISKHAE